VYVVVAPARTTPKVGKVGTAKTEAENKKRAISWRSLSIPPPKPQRKLSKYKYQQS
jgi:hypothetical protein